MRRQRREIETLSLSFLDVISCGFGALILLLVLTKVFEPIVLEQSIEDLQGYVAALELELMDIRGETRLLDREKIRKQDEQQAEFERLTALKARLDALQAQYAAVQDRTRINSIVERQLAQARQSLSAEMQRLLADYQKAADNNNIGGVPVDSEYVIFIIDTSGSMREYAWPLVMRKVSETLAVYPNLKGIQVMNDQGQYMFSQYTGQWIPDTPARRQAIEERLRNWNAFSLSSPERGIATAIGTFYQPGRKISLYVFGDDFNGRSIAAVINQIGRINQADANGDRMVRIHGVGFPTIFAQPAQYQASGYRFAHFMRILCERNGGTFVGLNDYRAF